MSLTPITGATYTPANGYTTPPKVLAKTSTDKLDLLYKVSLPDAEAGDDGFAFVYSKAALANNAVVPAAGLFLQNGDGSLFSVDLADNSRVSMVAEGKNLALYVYNPAAAGAAEKYTFNATTGISVDGEDQPAALDALAISAAEAKSARDLDGDGGIGAKLVTSGNGNGLLDTTGGLYRVNVAGQDLYVTGAGLDKATVLDVSKSALLNADGTYWAPGEEEGVLRIVPTINAATKATTFEVYATNADTQEVTRYKFDANRKLLADEDQATKVLNGAEVSIAEKAAKRDLNNDTFFGVKVETTAVDAKSGLFKGSVLGQSFFMVGTSLKTGTATAPTDTSGTLVNADGDPWQANEGFTIVAAVRGTRAGAEAGDPAVNTLTVYSVEGEGQGAVRNHVVKHTFTEATDAATGLKYFQIDEDTADGVDVEATELAAAETLAKRDLNGDTVFGVSVQGAADATGGLFRASALGHDFLLVGRSLTSSAAKPLNLSTALLNEDGTAWKPDDVSEIGADKLRIITRSDAEIEGGGAKYVVVAREDGGSMVAYGFDRDFKLMMERYELTPEELASEEVLTRRDLNGDGAFGAVVSSVADAKGGLYKASFESAESVYLLEPKAPPIGSKVAAKAVSLDNALRADGDFWNLDDPENFTIKGMYDDADGLRHVVAVSNADPTVVQDYAFSGTNFQSMSERSLEDVSTLEATAKRDLNGDGIVGVKITATADKVGGLQRGTAAGRDFLLTGATPRAVTDLSTMLRNSEGAAWGTTEAGTFDTNLFDPGADSLVLTGNAEAGWKLYVSKTGDDGVEIRQYAFDTNRTLIEDDDTGKVISGIALADAEKAASRDLNGDRSIGARLTLALDKVGGLYKAQLGSSDFYLLSSSTPEKGLALTGKVLLAEDGETAWQPQGSLTGVVEREGGGYEVFERVDDATVLRHRFDEGRVFQESETLTATQLATAEKVAGRDLSADKAVGVLINGAVDRAGGLYSARILGQDFFVAGTNLKTGKNADTAIDLSRALTDAEGNAWTKEEGYEIAGGVEREGGGYAVYAYKRDDQNNVTSVRRSTWDSSFNFQETAEADPVELVALEADRKRDLSGDGFVGFKVLTSRSIDGYAGVTEARVSGDTKFWLVGDAVKQGSKSNPLSLKNALLNEDGTGPWYLDSSYNIKAVDDSGAERQVYVANADNSVLRFSFDKQTGRVTAGGEPTQVTAVELAAREVTLKRDLNGDGSRGAVSVQPVGQTGLLDVGMLGDNYLVVGKAPAAGRSIDLSAALLNADGSAWKADEGVALKGVWRNTDGDTEVYGVSESDGSIQRFVFATTEGATTLTLKENGVETLSGTALAQRERVAAKDLNGDTRIGFKVKDSAPLASQTNGWALGEAGVGADAADQVYIIGRNLSQMGQRANNTANAAALVASVSDDGVATYWKPDEGYTVKSILQVSDTSVKVFLKQDEAGDDATDDYFSYEFAKGEQHWTLVPASEEQQATKMGPRLLVEAEVAAKRDLNGDGAFGLTIDENLGAVQGAFANLFSAHFDNTNMLVVGSNLSTGTAMKPTGFAGLLVKIVDEKPRAWTPDDGVTVSSLAKVTQADLDNGAPEGALYRAVLSDDSNVYFKQGLNGTFVQMANG